MKYKIITLVLGLSLLAAACNNTTNNGTTNNVTTPPPPPPPAAQPLSGTVEVTITDSAFSPADITVKSGTKVTFKNTGTKQHWPASAPHPSHTDLPGFDSMKGLANNETYSYTFTQVGKWKYHDHLNVALFGSVIVVE
jgi:plastocyanin